MRRQIFFTQGGGTVVYDEQQRWYVFLDPPEWSAYEYGDLMPEDWNIVPSAEFY